MVDHMHDSLELVAWLILMDMRYGGKALDDYFNRLWC